ncbi:50S ribosome-binding GTPase, partial [Candidatus Woesearchaeota archaeon]|nr:50S ribosome-binding GTPase [Candidatus Woesearchaeota archaeon]
MSADKILTQIKELEDELTKTKYNKKTQHHIGLVKAKIAKLKEKLSQKGKSSGAKTGYSVRKTGDGTVILVGFPSVGKSTLLNALTNANSEVGAYDFTTLDVIPGLLEHNYAKIQVLDVPGIVHGAASGRGRGREVLSVMRSADLAIIIIDATHPEHYKAILSEIHASGLRLNQRAPDVKITKKDRGGVRVGATVKLTKLTKKMVQDILREFGYANADIVIRENIDVDQLIDAIEGNRVYIPAVTIINKVDLVSAEKLEKIKKEVKPDICISAQQKTLIENVKDIIYNGLKVIRVYCKEVGKPADLDVPLIMFKGASVEDMCNK